MKNLKRIIPVVILLVLSVAAAFAQAPPPSSNPPGAPLDGLALALLAAGGGYAYSKLKKEDE